MKADKPDRVLSDQIGRNQSLSETTTEITFICTVIRSNVMAIAKMVILKLKKFK